jgi:secondary thiamine-phosphate synthase enzyme
VRDSTESPHFTSDDHAVALYGSERNYREEALKVVTTQLAVTASEKLAWVDLTDEVLRAVKDSGVSEGCVMAFSAHTTCALLINENESGALEDLRARLDDLVPHGSYYAHDDLTRRTENLVADERVNGRAHVAAMLMSSTSQTIPVASGDVLLGTWQRLLLLELDDPKPRTIHFQVWGI